MQKVLISRFKRLKGVKSINAAAKLAIANGLERFPEMSDDHILAALDDFAGQSYRADYSDTGKIEAFFKFLKDWKPGAEDVCHERTLREATGAALQSPVLSGTVEPANAGERPVMSVWPAYVQRWNDAVPEEVKIKYWTRNSPIKELAKAETDPQLVAEFDLICEKAIKVLKEGKYEVTFGWLFDKPKWNHGRPNWHSILDGKYLKTGTGEKKNAVDRSELKFD
jgi:hypothetical protein